MKEIDWIPDKDSLKLYCTEVNMKVFKNREFRIIYVEDVLMDRCYQMSMKEFVRWSKLGRRFVKNFEENQKKR